MSKLWKLLFHSFLALLIISGRGNAWLIQVADAGAINLVSTVTANNTSNAVTFTGLTGNDYHISCRGLVPATDAINASIQFSIASTFITANYNWNQEGYSVNDTMSTTSSGGAADSGMRFRANIGAISNDASGITLDFGLYNLATAVEHRIMGHSLSVSSVNAARYFTRFSGFYTAATTAVDGVRIITSSGNWTSGSCSLYSISQ